jgi:hypothetical protein
MAFANWKRYRRARFKAKASRGLLFMQRSVLICSERHNASTVFLRSQDLINDGRIAGIKVAGTALERGDPQVASGLTAMAVQFLDRAISVRQTGSVVQQQQQIQPKKEDE